MPFVKNSRLHVPLALLLALLVVSLATRPLQAQTEPDLRITDVDLSEFPEVNVRVLARDQSGRPLSDLGNLVVRENRAPIAERTLSRLPVGVDLVFVLDANPTLLLADDNSGVTRLEKVRASLGRFAEQAMSQDGLDRISVIVPDASGEGATFLAEDVSSPSALTGALASYDPGEPPRVTPLNAMLELALSHLAGRQEDGRYQAIVLLTDGARLGQQLNYPALVETAQSGGVTIWPVILGASADPEEVDNVTRLASPTGGQFIHMPEPEATDVFYATMQALGQQVNVAYRSLLRRPGEYELSVSLGNTIAEAPFTLELAQPVLTLQVPRQTIERAGSAPDSPLPLLQPAAIPLEITVSWPDGVARELTELAFLVDGRRQPLPFDIRPDDNNQMMITWDISNLDAGTYELLVQARDELGFTLSSEVQPVTITVTRPAPPAPTAEPTAIALPQIELPVPPELEEPVLWAVLVSSALVVAGSVSLVGWRRARKRRAAEEAAERRAALMTPMKPPSPRRMDRHDPFLVRLDEAGLALDRHPLEEADVTIGRDPQHVTLVIEDGTVSRLHARIRRNAQGEFWLYDEGSSSGTFLNYQRLALAPRELTHGDIVQFGRATYRFALELRIANAENEVESAETSSTEAVEEDD